MLPVTIITGFLGSGKTSLLNRILRENKHKQIGILLNEFGDRALETEFIVEDADGIVEFEGGCLCHAPVEKIVEAITKILDIPKQIDHLVIEASGLTNPLPVMQILNSPKLVKKVQLDSVICTIDALNFADHSRHHLLMQGQLLYADYVILTKTDIAPVETVKQTIESLLRLTPDLHIVDIKDLTSSRALLEQGKDKVDFSNADVDMDDEHVHFHQHLFTTALEIDRYLLLKALEDAPAEILRVKGVLYSNHHKREKFLVHKVGSRVDLAKASVSKDDDRVSKLLVIGTEVPEDFRRRLEAIVYKPQIGLRQRLDNAFTGFKQIWSGE